MEQKIGVALAKEACPVCTKLYDGPILIDRKIGSTKVEKFHQQTIGFMKHPCDECREKVKEGEGTWIIIIDESKTDDMRNPYRTGHVFALKREAAQEICGDQEFCYMGYDTAFQLGFPLEEE